MMRYILMIPLVLGLAGCPEKSKDSDDKKEDKKEKKDKEKEEASATATATATATAVATAEETAAPAEESAAAAAEIENVAGEVDSSTFASVQVPASVSVPTEEDYEAAVEKEITPENADEQLKLMEKELDAGP